MASQALTAFNAAVDAIPNGTALNAARKVTLKETGERLYIAGGKEMIRHLRKHAIAVRDDAGEPQAKRDFAGHLVTVCETINEQGDPWWITVPDGG